MATLLEPQVIDLKLQILKVVYADALMKVVRLMTKMWPMLSRRN
jgi:hypothetical protein